MCSPTLCANTPVGSAEVTQKFGLKAIALALGGGVLLGFGGAVVAMHVDDGGWWERHSAEVQGLAAVGVALATVGLAVVAAIALGQVSELRHARLQEAFLEIGRRWDSDDMIRSRTMVDACGTRLQTEIKLLFTTKPERYYLLLREPGFFEDIAALCHARVIDSAKLADSLGLFVIERWDVWEDAAVFLREERRSPEVFEHFERLAGEMKSLFDERRQRSR